MDSTTIDWTLLDRLRDHFLKKTNVDGPYWTSETDLDHYDRTFAERIGWKWDAVLDDLARLQWRPQSNTILDWGCGSGVAARRVLRAFGLGTAVDVQVWDHSPLATDFARKRIREEYPSAQVQTVSADLETAPGLLLISHVINELSPEDLDRLLRLVQSAPEVIWVEPGSYDDSRRLISAREACRSTHRIVAPCTHESGCGMLTEDNSRHWCHFFAQPPTEAFTDSGWAQFSSHLGIDLRSLPYSYLVLQRRDLPQTVSMPAGHSRSIGLPRLYKGFAKILGCDESGVTELTLQKRDEPTLWKRAKKSRLSGVMKWNRRDDRITGFESFPEDANAE